MDRPATAANGAASLAIHHLLLDGEWVEGAGARVTVHDKYRLQPVATLTTADAAQVRRAVDVAHAAFRVTDGVRSSLYRQLAQADKDIGYFVDAAFRGLHEGNTVIGVTLSHVKASNIGL